MQNLTPLALSSAEKSVTEQTKNTKNTNRKRYIQTLPIGMCDRQGVDILFTVCVRRFIGV